LVLGSLQLSASFYNSWKKENLISQKLALQKKLNKLDYNLTLMQQALYEVADTEDFYHLKYGLSSIDKDIRELGTGGTIHPESTFIADIYPVQSLRAKIESKVDGIKFRLDQSEAGFEQLKDHIEHKLNSWKHIPSVAPAEGRFASGYGIRNHPVTGERNKMHQGIDIVNDRWTPIMATADGVVVIVKEGDMMGKYVVIDHGNGYTTTYGHMEKIMVRAGQIVQRYQNIGYMGDSGRTTGIHVHYEVRLNDNTINPVKNILPTGFSVD
jgi:murein DD-endopeptidase MepM/ murein hydrolase activator NlpD